MIRAIVFATQAECLAFQNLLLQRVSHLPEWVPFEPLALSDGRWIAQIPVALTPSLTAEEIARIENVDPGLIPQQR